MRYEKTEAGRAEAQRRSHDLSRSARNLLLIINASRDAGQWVSLVQGATTADLDRLAALQLIAAPTGSAATVAAAQEPAPTADSAAQALEPALQALSYRELYELLTAQARPLLGLIKGYKMVLEIERCGDAESLRSLALRFVDDVRAARGDAAAAELGRLLGAGR